MHTTNRCECSTKKRKLWLQKYSKYLALILQSSKMAVDSFDSEQCVKHFYGFSIKNVKRSCWLFRDSLKDVGTRIFKDAHLSVKHFYCTLFRKKCGIWKVYLICSALSWIKVNSAKVLSTHYIRIQFHWIRWNAHKSNPQFEWQCTAQSQP